MFCNEWYSLSVVKWVKCNVLSARNGQSARNVQASVPVHATSSVTFVLETQVRRGAVLTVTRSSTRWAELVHVPCVPRCYRSVQQHLRGASHPTPRCFQPHEGRWTQVQPGKCSLFQWQMDFLGYVVSSAGVEPNGKKVETINTWPVLKDVMELRAFLGLIGYYRRWVEGFARRTRPLFDLLRKDTRFHWGKQQQTAFEDLKNCLVTAPILGLPVDNSYYMLDTNASDFTAGAE